MAIVRLQDKDNGSLIGEVDRAELQVLVDALEEEHARDRDYYIDAATLEYLEREFPAAAGLVTMLRRALGDREGMDIEWTEA